MTSATRTNADLATLLVSVLTIGLPEPTLASVWVAACGPRIDLQFSGSDVSDTAALSAWAGKFGARVVSGRRNRDGQVPMTLDFTHEGVSFHAYAYIGPRRRP
jgi:hypothetical protein